MKPITTITIRDIGARLSAEHDDAGVQRAGRVLIAASRAIDNMTYTMQAWLRLVADDRIAVSHQTMASYRRAVLASMRAGMDRAGVSEDASHDKPLQLADALRQHASVKLCQVDEAADELCHLHAEVCRLTSEIRAIRPLCVAHEGDMPEVCTAEAVRAIVEQRDILIEQLRKLECGAA